MESTAHARYIKISTRKLRLVADVVRKLTPAEAVKKLALMNQRGAQLLSDVVVSALANARNKRMGESVRFRAIEVSRGPLMKRFRPVSRGMAHSYTKKMSHVTIVLSDEQVPAKSKN